MFCDKKELFFMFYFSTYKVHLYIDQHMFTGIITHQWQIIQKDQWLFTLQKPTDLLLNIWQSIAHDGACMTVTEITDETYSFFAMEESLSKTNFTQKMVGDRFNLELCVQANQMLDGHIVTGHIDTTWTISSVLDAEDGSRKLTITYDPQRDVNILPKGSIALNGVSLTVVETWSGRCTVRLIPLTQTLTNLWTVAIGSVVNIEFDMVGKYVLNYMQHAQKQQLT